jgi:HK97 gp10 family phage protein
MNISVRITSNQWGNFLAKFQREGSKAVAETLEEIRAEAAARSRVDTGQMRDGWATVMDSPTSGTVVNEVEYTAFNEWGTVKMPAQPMLTPAVEHARPRLTVRLSNVIQGD